MSKQSKKDKDQDVYWMVVTHAVQLDISKGHLKWSISDLARSSKVTRSLIYYYFGKSKSDIIAECLSWLEKNIFSVPTIAHQAQDTSWMIDSLIAKRKLLENHPTFIAFYVFHRVRKSPIGTQFEKMERNYVKQLQKVLPELKSTRVHFLFANIFGLLLAPMITYDEIKKYGPTLVQLFHAYK